MLLPSIIFFAFPFVQASCHSLSLPSYVAFLPPLFVSSSLLFLLLPRSLAVFLYPSLSACLCQSLVLLAIPDTIIKLLEDRMQLLDHYVLHTRTLHFTCFYDKINRIQDLKMCSHADCLILSQSSVLWVAAEE